MKRHFLTSLFVFLVSLGAFCKDNYSHKTYVQGTDITYRVIVEPDEDDPFIILDNINNVLSDKYPYDKATKQYYSDAMHPMPLAEPDYDLLKEIVDSVFSNADKTKYFSDNCELWVTLRINPITSHAIEMMFHIEYTPKDKRILSLPVSKLEQLEKALKKDLIFKVPSAGKDADFLLLSGRVF